MRRARHIARGPHVRTIVLASVASGIAVLPPSRAQAQCSNDNVCSGGPARIMFVLDASSDMLNRGPMAGAMGMTDWDVFRSTIAGPGTSAVFDAPVQGQGLVASQVAHFGLVVYGDSAPAPGEQKVVVDYGPCTRPNIDWALDPETSCASPGCVDPWAGPPISWTFVDGSAVDPPNFALRTISHVPRCEGTGNDCQGSGRSVHLGIELATQNRMSYRQTTPFTEDGSTQYVNILVVSNEYTGFSTDAQVQGALEAAHTAGITTFVVGFGTGAQAPSATFTTQLESMADWGSAGALDPFVARNAGELANVLQEIIANLELPCCKTIDCSAVGGADTGDSGTDTDADTWGSADGSGSASDTSAETDSASGSSGEIDDDGGCTCAVPHSPTYWLLALTLLGLRRRSSAKEAEPAQ